VWVSNSFIKTYLSLTLPRAKHFQRKPLYLFLLPLSSSHRTTTLIHKIEDEIGEGVHGPYRPLLTRPFHTHPFIWGEIHIT
jgi:hypothetical protein